MVFSMIIQEVQDTQVLSSIILHNQHYIILVIRRCFPLTLLFTYLP
jgi:hypothetical protein